MYHGETEESKREESCVANKVFHKAELTHVGGRSKSKHGQIQALLEADQILHHEVVEQIFENKDNCSQRRHNPKAASKWN